EEHSHILPVTLDNAGVHTLAVSIVASVSELRRLSRDVESTDVSRQEYLNLHHPGWKQKIPMRIDDSEAVALILGLLDQETTRALPAEGFSIATSMTRKGENYVVCRELIHESQVSEDDLWKWLEVESADSLHPRMMLHLLSDVNRIRLATVSRRSNGDQYHITKVASPPLTGVDGVVRLMVTA
ncbi:MAG: hypothetical protein ABGW78_00410, partial [Pirellulales bacterium]